MRQAPQDEQQQAQSIQGMPAEKIQDYMKQGTYGIQKLYHDTGMPEKAKQYGQLQTDVQDKVYQGNARLLDIKEPVQLQAAANKTRAIISEYANLKQDDDQALAAFAKNVARVGGPDLSKYDADVQRQGFELWSSTFNDQMSQIASSERGRQLYGNVLSESFDYSKNVDHQQLKSLQYLESEDGKNGIRINDALKNGKQLYVTGHWSKPRISDAPDALMNPMQEEQVNRKPQMSQQEQQSLVSDAMSLTAGQDFDVEKVSSVAQKFIDSGIEIDMSSPQAMTTSLAKAAKDSANATLNYQSSQNKDIAAQNAVTINENNLKYNRLESWHAIDMLDPADKEGRQRAIEQFKEANTRYHEFNIHNLSESTKKDYDAAIVKFDNEKSVLDGQTVALARAVQAISAMDPRAVGEFGPTYDKVLDFVELAVGSSKDLSSPEKSREALDQAIAEFKWSMAKTEGGARLMDKYGTALEGAGLQTFVDLLQQTNEARQVNLQVSEAYKNHVGEYKSTVGAPERSSHINNLVTVAESSLSKIPKSQSGIDNQTMQEKLIKPQRQQEPQQYDMDAIRAEAMRRGLIK